MSLHSHKASDTELQFEPRSVGFFPCSSYLPWIGSHLNPEELKRATETTPGKDEPQREGQTAHGREVLPARRSSPEGFLWNNWKTANFTRMGCGQGLSWEIKLSKGAEVGQ